MAWAFVLDNADMSLEDYDRLSEEVGQDAPQGLIVHVAGPTPDGGGTRIIDVWESKGDFDRFMESRLMPAMQRLGIPAPDAPPPMEELETRNIIRG